MKWHRIKAIIMRHLYIQKRSIPRMMDIFFWPVMNLLTWGFLSLYVQKLDLVGLNLATFLLGAIIFWEFFNMSQRSISISFLEDVWEKNLLNVFVTPLRMSEYIAASFVIAIAKMTSVAIVMALLSVVFYHFNLFSFGFYLIPFVVNLLIFGWTLGLLVIAVILRFGSSAQIFAFGIIFLIQPFSAVFYPISALPVSISWISYLLPTSYVFEGMRAVAATGILPTNLFVWGTVSNLIYLVLVLWIFYGVFRYVKDKGLLLKLN